MARQRVRVGYVDVRTTIVWCDGRADRVQQACMQQARMQQACMQ